MSTLNDIKPNNMTKPGDIYQRISNIENPFKPKQITYTRIIDVQPNSENEIWIKYMFVTPIKPINNSPVHDLFKNGILEFDMPLKDFLRLYEPYIPSKEITKITMINAIKQLEIKCD